MNARVAALAIATLALAGCEHMPAPKPEPAAAPVPVVAPQPESARPPPPPVAAAPVRPERSCVPRGVGPPPRYPDTDAALRNAPGAADRYQLMAAGRLMRQRRLQELERVLAGCR